MPVDQFVLTYKTTNWTTPDEARAQLSMFRVAPGGRRVAIPFDVDGSESYAPYVLRPEEPLPIGTIVQVEAKPPRCPDEHLKVTYEIVAPKPLPSSLGSLQTTYSRSVLTVFASAQCSAKVDAVYADITLAMAPDAAPFAGLVAYQLLVDKWSARPLSLPVPKRGAAPEYGARVHAICQLPSESVSLDWVAKLGTHRVQLVGKLPNGSELRTDEIEITLDCNDFAAPPAGWDKS